MSWFAKIKNSLKRSNVINKITSAVSNTIVLDDQFLEELESVLIQSDMGADLTSDLIEILRYHKFSKNQDGSVDKTEVEKFLITKIVDIVNPFHKEIKNLVYDGQLANRKSNSNDVDVNKKQPIILNFVGVNGSGKTTTIGKLAALLSNAGFKVAIAACDTFRAAAVEQVKTWADRSKVEIFYDVDNNDPAAVAFSAVKMSKEQDIDVLLVDTAGRLHAKNELMEQLSKIERVIIKALKSDNESKDLSKNIHNILVVDATSGQNAYLQAQTFAKFCQLSGFILTKLDGTAKGGIALQIIKKQQLPIYAVSVGESIDDIGPFVPQAYAQGLIMGDF